MFEKVKEIMKSFVDEGMPGCDCIVLKDGKEIFRHFEGFRDKEKTMPIDGNERYNIYSCSKIITCTLALMLVEQGKLSLEDKLAKYIPEYENITVKAGEKVKKAENPILIKHLFMMASGLDYNVNRESIERVRKRTNGACPTVEIVKELASDPLIFEPGTRWEYGLSHDVLAAVVEIVSGVRFSEFARKNIFEPLGMTKTTYLLPDSELDTICPQYDRDENRNIVRVSNEIQYYKFGYEYECGGAGCISTVADYIKFAEALRTGKLLKPETVELMQTDMLTTDELKENYWESLRNSGCGFGLGVRCKQRTEPNLTEFGWAGAAGAIYSIDTKKNVTIYYAQQVLSSDIDHWKMIEEIYKEIDNM